MINLWQRNFGSVLARGAVQMLAEMSENASSVYIASRAACWLAWLSPGLCKRYYASSCSLKAKALL
ncbi:MAG: hypothetical protein AAF320_05915, partial [Myxococcota bacterium]